MDLTVLIPAFNEADSLKELHKLGYVSVGYVLTGLFMASRALDEAYRHLLEHGSSDGLRDRMMGFDEFTEMLGIEDKYRLDEQFGAD